MRSVGRSFDFCAVVLLSVLPCFGTFNEVWNEDACRVATDHPTYYGCDGTYTRASDIVYYKDSNGDGYPHWQIRYVASDEEWRLETKSRSTSPYVMLEAYGAYSRWSGGAAHAAGVFHLDQAGTAYRFDIFVQVDFVPWEAPTSGQVWIKSGNGFYQMDYSQIPPGHKIWQWVLDEENPRYPGYYVWSPKDEYIDTVPRFRFDGEVPVTNYVPGAFDPIPDPTDPADLSKVEGLLGQILDQMVASVAFDNVQYTDGVRAREQGDSDRHAENVAILRDIRTAVAGVNVESTVHVDTSALQSSQATQHTDLMDGVASLEAATRESGVEYWDEASQATGDVVEDPGEEIDGVSTNTATGDFEGMTGHVVSVVHSWEGITDVFTDAFVFPELGRQGDWSFSVPLSSAGLGFSDIDVPMNLTLWEAVCGFVRGILEWFGVYLFGFIGAIKIVRRAIA